jgi:beta-lactamase superfamily II metal-dependent hydrolase
VLRIEMLPAEKGDCLWIEYGPADKPRRILIDGGTHATYELLRKRIEQQDDDERTFQLLVITHIDNDHIDGIVRLLQNPQIGYRFRDIWFNGWPQLDDPQGDALGPVQGEYMAARIRNRRLPWNQNRGLPWNRTRDERAVVIARRQELPRIPLGCGLELVLLSPTPDKLTSLRSKWRSVVTDAEKDYPDPGSSDDWLRLLEEDRRYRPDDDSDALGPAKPPDVQALLKAKTGSDGSAANGSSIAFLLEYDGKRCLLTGDAHPKVLADSLELYLAEKGLDRLPVDVFKLPHHGSKNNVSRRLLGLLECRRYLISTDSSGSRHKHPDDEAIARILAYGGDDKVLFFNYRVDQTEKWDDAELRDGYDYRPRYPPRGGAGIAVQL